jgi:serine/threonine protein kinase
MINSGGNDERNYVVKTFFNSSLEDQRPAIEAFRGSPFIRQQVDEATNPTAVVLEYLNEDLLSLSSKRRLKMPEIKAIGKRILQAICSMHQSGYVHTGIFKPPGHVPGLRSSEWLIVDGLADIKLNNVLINHENGASQITDIKLADCETAALIEANNFIASGPIGAAIFRSPEAFFQRGVGPPTDIWSFGTMVSSAYYLYLLDL